MPVLAPGIARGPMGTIITREHLPSPRGRWTAMRKAIVVTAVSGGVISREEATKMYAISDEELTRWAETMKQGGVPGLNLLKSLRNRRRAQMAANENHK